MFVLIVSMYEECWSFHPDQEAKMMFDSCQILESGLGIFSTPDPPDLCLSSFFFFSFPLSPSSSIKVDSFRISHWNTNELFLEHWNEYLTHTLLCGYWSYLYLLDSHDSLTTTCLLRSLVLPKLLDGVIINLEGSLFLKSY